MMDARQARLVLNTLNHARSAGATMREQAMLAVGMLAVLEDTDPTRELTALLTRGGHAVDDLMLTLRAMLVERGRGR